MPYALHAPEVECIGKGKARQPYEFGVNTSVAVTHRHDLIVGARSFPGNPDDGLTLAAQLEQTTTLLRDISVKPGKAIVDLGYRGVDAEIASVQLILRGKTKTLTTAQRAWLRRREAVEPAIGNLKVDHGMDLCWLTGSAGDALHAVLCAAGSIVRWLLRATCAWGSTATFFGPGVNHTLRPPATSHPCDPQAAVPDINAQSVPGHPCDGSRNFAGLTKALLDAQLMTEGTASTVEVRRQGS